MADDIRKPDVSFNKDKIQWPLSYSLISPKAADPPRQHWNYWYYQGPQGRCPQILYSKSASNSEAIARTFLNEPVLGFDMEWPMDADKRSRIQEKVALIQIACERRIALFHIALHDGETSKDIIAPSLRNIIESPYILKTGVAIVKADFKRLRYYFQLQTRGAFELSHLHSLVRSGSQPPEQATTRLWALSKQVEQHLGLPLHKGSVRTSDWSKPLNEEQRRYAANDAYAAYMLFHCMNAKRLRMDPVLPLPTLGAPPVAKSDVVAAQVQSAIKFTKAVVTSESHSCATESAANLLKQDDEEKVEARGESKTGGDKVEEQVAENSRYVGNTIHTSQISPGLLNQLISHRRRVATSQGVPAFVIASNKLLEALATDRPANKSQLLKVKGVGRSKEKMYGDEWLRLIAEDVAKHPGKGPAQATAPSELTTPNLRTEDQRDGYQELQKLASIRDQAKLYQRLAEHRKMIAVARGWSAFIIAPNRLLQELARSRPSSQRELLQVSGMGKSKAAEYGPAWLRIIATFESEHGFASSPNQVANPPANPPIAYPPLQQPKAPSRELKRSRIRNVGRSKELLPSTGLSFLLADAGLDVDIMPTENNDGRVNGGFDISEESMAFEPYVATPAPSALRCKQEEQAEG
ncbi:hypothetical protein GGR54DRAFT_615607 [Hypoxylon sp. NC1633]|nr:hypothetical protein GGR54DRAFT_615607 [Hypoxylon sp. NC1633]